MQDSARPDDAEPGLTFHAPEQLFADPVAESRWRGRVTGLHIKLPRSARSHPSRSMYESNRSGAYELWLWDRDSDQHRQATDRDNGTQLGELSADGRWAWWFADTGGNEFGRWMRQPWDGGPDEPATPGIDDGMASGIALGDGVAVIALANPDGVRVWRQYDGADPAVIYHSEQDALLASLSADSSRAIVRHSEHGDASNPGMRALDLATGETTAELTDPGTRLVPCGFAPTAGDPRLLAIHERRGRDELLVWDTSSGDQHELVIDLPGQLDARWLGDTALVVLHSHAGRVQMFRYELANGALNAIGPQTGCVDDAAVRPDGTIEYSWSSSAAAPRVQHLSADGDTVLFPEADQMPADSVPVEDVWVDGPGGPIHTLIMRPTGSRERPNQTLFWLHGGPYVHDRDVFSARQAAWVDAGFTVVSLNYRGSTGYGAAWRQSITGRPGRTEIEDLAAVHDWCVATGITDPGASVLEGYSWGGYLVLLALAYQADRWTAGVAGLPITDHTMSYADAPEPLRAMARALFGGAPDAVPDRYATASPLEAAGLVRAPVLIIAGRNDPRCPLRQIDAYAQRLTELGRPPAVYRYDGGHGSGQGGTVTEFLRVAISFARAALTEPGTHQPTVGEGAR